ncbi:hypothetical protein [Streptomyces gardneri]|uniref:hypothetical protein n=1 Tax=Streptomyces gardneri TaxID=66892 RepID=UPI0035DD2EBF
MACAVAAAALLAAPPPTSATVEALPCVRGESETKGFSAVDSGEIRWTDKTKYDRAREHALKVWKYPGSRITLAPDGAFTVNDLEFRDYKGSSADSAAVASYTNDSGVGATDYITFNTTKMDGRGRDFQNSGAAHEVGHALGLCHKGDRFATLMMKRIQTPPITEPTSIDKANYKRLWG